MAGRGQGRRSSHSWGRRAGFTPGVLPATLGCRAARGQGGSPRPLPQPSWGAAAQKEPSLQTALRARWPRTLAGSPWQCPVLQVVSGSEPGREYAGSLQASP